MQNFTTATVDTNILQISKQQNALNTKGSRIDNDFHPSTHSISDYISLRKASFQFSSDDEWVIVKPINLKLKQKIEKAGIPLSKWDIEINYGIKTGLNEAFIIDETTKSDILKNQRDAVEILHPMLKGRDIQKWQPEYSNLWLVGTHNGTKKTPKIESGKYPAIIEWLNTHEPKPPL